MASTISSVDMLVSVVFSSTESTSARASSRVISRHWSARVESTVRTRWVRMKSPPPPTLRIRM